MKQIDLRNIASNCKKATFLIEKMQGQFTEKL